MVENLKAVQAAILNISIDFGWSQRGHQATHRALRVVVDRSQVPEIMNDRSCIIYIGARSKPHQKTIVDKETANKKQININTGKHQGSSRSMEHAETKQLLSYLRHHFHRLNVPHFKVVICLDGDTSLNSALLEDEIVHQTVRDRAHILKNIGKNVRNNLGVNKKGEAHAASLTSWAAIVLNLADENDWSEEEAREKLQNYLRHHSGNHTNCLSNAKCKNDCYVPDDLLDLSDDMTTKQKLNRIIANTFPVGSQVENKLV